MTPDPLQPEAQARVRIDAQLEASGWVVQDWKDMNLYAAQGVAVREFVMATGYGFADYLLFVDQKAVGVLEAKKEGFTLSGVEGQAEKYSKGLPENLSVPVRPLPFLYQANGEETRFTNGLDPDPRAREVFQIHRPETLAEWLLADNLDDWVKSTGSHTAADDTQPSTFRSRLQTLPELERSFLFPNQFTAIGNLEHSLKQNHPRSLIQMATGSGKTIMAITALYRLIKFSGARRTLFLVDRKNLGEQAEKEFQGFRTPDDNKKFTELYNVQLLQSNSIRDSSKVAITTIQRLYSMLKGEPDLDPALEEESAFEGVPGRKEPMPVVYNDTYPPEFFDLIVVDECHRSIYSLWRQVLEYFDAFLVGLTATPAKHTFGFFNKNLVMEYDHDKAVADGVNVDFDVYQIKTQITEQGSTIEANDDLMLTFRDRSTRAKRWETPDEDVDYTAGDLDRKVVAKDQIRTIVRTFKEKLYTEIFPGRTEVPKTLIFAKDDSHAEDIVDIVREEFERGNDFCQKITYKTTAKKPKELIQDFRNSYEPRIAVTVDMIATGTDIKPIEIVMFMRAVKSRGLFEQMKGRGVRVISKTDMKAVSPDAKNGKTHFVIVDCVGQLEMEISDTHPLERKKYESLKSLLNHVAAGGTDPDVLSSLASRLSRLEKKFSVDDQEQIRKTTEGVPLKKIARALVDAVDPDVQIEKAREVNHLPEDAEPTEAQVKAVADDLKREAAKPLAANPKLRNTILELKQKFEQLIDEVSIDHVLYAGVSEEAKEKAKALVQDFETFLVENRDEIDALQFFYAQPHRRRLTFTDIKGLAEAIKAPPRSWTPDLLWRAYETMEKSRVRGASGRRQLVDLVSLVKFALKQEPVLEPVSEHVKERFDNWLAQQETAGRRFTDEQTRWLTMIRDHIASSWEMEIDDFDYAPFAEAGGLGRASQVFGQELNVLLKELNEALVA